MIREKCAEVLAKVAVFILAVFTLAGIVGLAIGAFMAMLELTKSNAFAVLATGAWVLFLAYLVFGKHSGRVR
jgi:hypothetical protein